MDPKLENASNEIVQASTQIQQTVPEKPKKSTGLITTVILMAILALAGIAGAIFFYLDANNKATDIVKLKSELDLVKQETGIEVVEKEEDGVITTVVEINNSDEVAVKTIAKQVYQALTDGISGGQFETVFGNGSIIKIPNTTTYSSSNESYGVVSWGSFYNSSVMDLVMQNAHVIAENTLKENGFSEDREVVFGRLFYNSTTGIYCDVNESSVPFSMSCSKDTWISDQDEDLAVELSKIANTDYVSVVNAKVKDSSVSPYQTLTAGGFNYAMLFYRTSPDAEWQYFTGTQGVLPCTDYNTQDLKNAYAGETCFDESNGQSITIQP